MGEHPVFDDDRGQIKDQRQRQFSRPGLTSDRFRHSRALVRRQPDLHPHPGATSREDEGTGTLAGTTVRLFAAGRADTRSVPLTSAEDPRLVTFHRPDNSGENPPDVTISLWWVRKSFRCTSDSNESGNRAFVPPAGLSLILINRGRETMPSSCAYAAGRCFRLDQVSPVPVAFCSTRENDPGERR